MVNAPGSSSSAYQYGATSGYRTDGDAGLMLVGARYYDPQIGRFLTRDTVLTELPYVYCGGDPVNAVDPSGHRSQGDAIGAIGAVLFIVGVLGKNPQVAEWGAILMAIGVLLNVPPPNPNAGLLITVAPYKGPSAMDGVRELQREYVNWLKSTRSGPSLLVP